MVGEPFVIKAGKPLIEVKALISNLQTGVAAARLRLPWVAPKEPKAWAAMDPESGGCSIAILSVAEAASRRTA